MTLDVLFMFSWTSGPNLINDKATGFSGLLNKQPIVDIFSKHFHNGVRQQALNESLETLDVLFMFSWTSGPNLTNDKAIEFSGLLNKQPIIDIFSKHFHNGVGQQALNESLVTLDVLFMFSFTSGPNLTNDKAIEFSGLLNKQPIVDIFSKHFHNGVRQQALNESIVTLDVLFMFSFTSGPNLTNDKAIEFSGLLNKQPIVDIFSKHFHNSVRQQALNESLVTLDVHFMFSFTSWPNLTNDKAIEFSGLLNKQPIVDICGIRPGLMRQIQHFFNSSMHR